MNAPDRTPVFRDTDGVEWVLDGRQAQMVRVVLALAGPTRRLRAFQLTRRWPGSSGCARRWPWPGR